MPDTNLAKMQFILALKESGIWDQKVLGAMEAIDRKNFVTPTFMHHAYRDAALPIACGQTISRPTVVGVMTQALALQPKDKVLEIGTGSGYQTAVLSHLANRIYTIERHRELMLNAKQKFSTHGYSNIISFLADGSKGLPHQAPFDKIIVTAASEDAPTTLLSQLKVGGIMVVPVGQSNVLQNLVKITKLKKMDNEAQDDKGEKYHYDYEELQEIPFLPLLDGLGDENSE